MNTISTKLIKKYLDRAKTKAVEVYDFENKKVKYSEKIKNSRKIDKIGGDEEIVRIYILNKLVNDLGYKPENIEVEKEYDIGRPKTNKPRIDVIVRDSAGNAERLSLKCGTHSYHLIFGVDGLNLNPL